MHRRARVDGVATAWVEASPAKDEGGAPFVLVPGLSMSWHAYRWLIPHLAHTRSLLVVDPPGAGRSRRLPGDMGVEAQAAHLSRWLDVAGVDDADLAGHSLGALTAARLAALRPGLARSVTLISPSPDPGLPRLRDHIGALVRGVPDEAPRVLAQAAGDYLRSSPLAVAAFRAEIGRGPGSVAQGVSAPVTVVRGSADEVSSQEWCAAIATAAGGRLAVVPDGGHGLPQQHPQAVAAILDQAALR